MAIVVRLDVMLALRKVRSKELADAIGIRSAYGLVTLLLVSVFLIDQIAGRSPAVQDRHA